MNDGNRLRPWKNEIAQAQAQTTAEDSDPQEKKFDVLLTQARKAPNTLKEVALPTGVRLPTSA